MKKITTHLDTPLRFLIVDDSRAIQAIMRRAITGCGYEPVEIQTATDGVQALDILTGFTPDLVITDWHMPKMSGLELVQTMRQLGQDKVSVGFVTTERSDDLMAQAIRQGAMFILHKPFNDAELVAAVKACVQDLPKVKAGQLVTQSAENDAAAKPAPEEEQMPEDDGTPVAPNAMQIQLKQFLGKIPFRLIPDDKMTLDKLTSNVFLGLYAAVGSKAIYAVSILDTNAVCMIGGGASRKNPTEVRAAMALGQPDADMTGFTHDFLRAAAAGLRQSSPTPVTLAKASVVKNNFAKLAEVLEQQDNRSDYRLSIPGYGEGRIAFFVM
jgi:CheY-like chemotaxis protein